MSLLVSLGDYLVCSLSIRFPPQFLLIPHHIKECVHVCYVELLWLSAVTQPIALDQDPLVGINVSSLGCSKVLPSDAISKPPSL